MTTPRAQAVLHTLRGIDPLSELPRTGWLLRGVRPCESIADHSFAVAFLAMLFVDAVREEGLSVDGEKVLRMALVHDAAEARTGDVPMPNKTPAMSAALHALEAMLIEGLLAVPQRDAWMEAETGDSLEARIVKAADKVQMMVKAWIYELQHRGQLDGFWQNPKNFDDRGIAIAREVFEAIAEKVGRVIPR